MACHHLGDSLVGLLQLELMNGKMVIFNMLTFAAVGPVPVFPPQSDDPKSCMLYLQGVDTPFHVKGEQMQIVNTVAQAIEKWMVRQQLANTKR